MNWLWYVRRGLLVFLSVDQFLFFLAVIQDLLRRVRMEVLLLCMLSELSLVCVLRVLGVLPIHTCIEDFGQSIDEVEGYLYPKLQILRNTSLVFYDSLLVEIASSAGR